MAHHPSPPFVDPEPPGADVDDLVHGLRPLGPPTAAERWSRVLDGVRRAPGRSAAAAIALLVVAAAGWCSAWAKKG